MIGHSPREMVDIGFQIQRRWAIGYLDSSLYGHEYDADSLDKLEAFFTACFDGLYRQERDGLTNGQYARR